MGSQVKLTDAEKTRRLAEGCMGWKYSRADKHHHAAWKTVDGGYLRYDVWQPLHNEAHAAEVRERMRELGWWCQMRTPFLASENCNRAGFCQQGVTGFNGRMDFRAKHELMPTAICHAALLAIGLAKEEEL